MISEEEKQQIIDAAVEKALLLLPSVMGNLMAQQATYSRLTSQFYKDHPSFAKHKDVVAACIEKVDGSFPTLPYEEKLKRAIPDIEATIKTLSVAGTQEVQGKPNRQYDGPLEAKRPFTDHGEI